MICGRGRKVSTRKSSLAATRKDVQEALRCRRRTDLARCLQSEALREIHLGPAQNLDPLQTKQDLDREPTLWLNGIPYGKRHPRKYQDFEEKLNRLCHGVLRLSDCDNTERAQELKDALLLRLSRTIAGAESYSYLNSLLGLDKAGNDFVLMPRQSLYHKGPKLEIRISTSSKVKARILCANSFALHRFCDGHAEDEVDLSLLFSKLDHRDDSTTELRRSTFFSAMQRPHSSIRTHAEWLPIDTLVTDELILNYHEDHTSLHQTIPGPQQSKRFLSIAVPSRWSHLVAF